MRILFYTGKGGVGKTSIAAATALRIARGGRRTLLMSTDQAHSLGDSLELPPDRGVRAAEENLDVLEVDPSEEGRKAWGNIKEYLRQVIREKANDGLAAEEAILFPGMEELFSLLRILEIRDEDRYEVLVVDCAPTGETLSLLRYPERLSVLADSILPSVRSVNRAFGGLISRRTSVPKPRDAVFEELDALVKRLVRLREILCDREQTSLRIVMTPERIVMEEARRSYAWLQAYDFGVDAVYVNRLFPEEALEGYFGAWKELQEGSLKLAAESFPGQRLFTLELQSGELKGIPGLIKAAELLYAPPAGAEGAGTDPSEVFCREAAFRMEDESGTRKFLVRLPHLRQEDIEVLQEGSDLILRVRNETRRFHLPDKVSRRYVSGWEYDGKELCIRMDYD